MTKVMPAASHLTVKVPNRADRFAALVTAVRPDAPPILRWDRDEARNPFSWYYSGGVDAEMRRRVTEAGGRVDDVDFRATLLWNTRDDLDLHVMTPMGEIYFAQKKIGDGWLDVDMNVRGETEKPVENVRWPRGTFTKPGKYLVAVHQYCRRDLGEGNEFTLELELFGQTYRRTMRYPKPGQTLTVFAFALAADGTVYPLDRDGLVPDEASAGQELWGLPAGSDVPVVAIAHSPNAWGTLEQSGHVLFLLEGCRGDTKAARGFFNEMLRGELHSVRSVMEAYAAKTPVADVDGPVAAGIGLSKDGKVDLIVTANVGGTATTYHIDRWE